MGSDQPTPAPAARPASPPRPEATRSIEGITAAFREQGYIASARSRPPCSWRSSSGARCSSRARPASARPRSPRSSRRAGLAPDPAPVLRGPGRQHRGLRVELPAPDARDPAARGARRGRRATAHDIFGPEFLIKRPLLQALESTDGDAPVLLIDEIDRADEEFEAYLLEILSDFQVTVPEIGTIRAERPPRVVLTSNRTREVHDALKRRCLYHWIDYPTAPKEFEIVQARARRAGARWPGRSSASSSACARRT